MNRRVVVVTGGRDFTDRTTVYAALDAQLEMCGIDVLVHGDCQAGVDALADAWARERGVLVVRYPADWRMGTRAGPIRNRTMLTEARPDLVLAGSGSE